MVVPVVSFTACCCCIAIVACFGCRCCCVTIGSSCFVVSFGWFLFTCFSLLLFVVVGFCLILYYVDGWGNVHLGLYSLSLIVVDVVLCLLAIVVVVVPGLLVLLVEVVVIFK